MRARGLASVGGAGAGAGAPAGGTVEDAEEMSPPKAGGVLVLGGSGYVGRAVCESLVSATQANAAGGGGAGGGILSLSRSGYPTTIVHGGKPVTDGGTWRESIEWLRGDVRSEADLLEAMEGCDAVVSCIGAFGSDAFMLEMNGDVNVNAVHLARSCGVKRFVFISAADFKFPSFVLRGYFEGKRNVEHALATSFPSGGVALKPGMVYGSRIVGSMALPLWMVGQPMEMIFSSTPGRMAKGTLPLVGPLLEPPISVQTVGAAAASAALNGQGGAGLLWGYDDMEKAAKALI